MARNRHGATLDSAEGPERIALMTDMQWFAFVILPLVVGALGYAAAWLGERFIP